jgi:hypothetical protein
VYLQRLELWWIGGRQGSQGQFISALRENKGLVHLAFSEYEMDDWKDLLDSLSKHPSLRSLDLQMHDWYTDEETREFTKAVADKLSVNERVEVMSIVFRNNLGETPLHVACHCGAAFEIVRSYDPWSITIKPPFRSSLPREICRCFWLVPRPILL